MLTFIEFLNYSNNSMHKKLAQNLKISKDSNEKLYQLMYAIINKVKFIKFKYKNFLLIINIYKKSSLGLPRGFQRSKLFNNNKSKI